ncbi:hypothetical protein D3C80_1439090 [compost metagenome]
MGNFPNFLNPEIPPVFDAAVNNKNAENQNSETQKEYEFIVGFHLIGIKRFKENNDEGQ